MQDWLLIGSGLIVSTILAQAGGGIEMPGWITTIGPWGVMCLVVERLTSNHSRALGDVTSALKSLEKTVSLLAVIVAKIEGIKQEHETEEE